MPYEDREYTLLNTKYGDVIVSDDEGFTEILMNVAVALPEGSDTLWAMITPYMS
jgi:hypothetical protein